jgi:2-polyprenyl-3-methyl-5-hydroxy-6-metoxy-1,4-benzoquinol methylase
MFPNCHICNTESKFLLRKDGFDLYKCPQCGLVFVYPQPSQETLAKDFYSEESGYQSNRAEDLSMVKETKRAKKVFGILEKLKPGGNILDVGCSGGHFMYWAQKRGFKPVGVELNKKTADSAKSHGFEVFNGFIENAPFEPKSFDIVFLGEVIEHVNNPCQFIKDSTKFLKLGGIVVITTPNIDCFWSRSTFLLYKIFKIPWSSVTPPYHLFQFDSNNLNLLLRKEGFKLIKELYILMTRLKYELGMLHLLKKFKNSKKVSGLVSMFFSFCLYGLLYLANIVVYSFLRKDFNMIKIYRYA